MIKLSIRRPVAVSMAYFGVALLGVAAWRNVPIELLPDTDLPQLTVTANWPGASPEAMEAFVTAPLEAAIQQVRGVEKITSYSEEDRNSGSATCRITVEFEREVDHSLWSVVLAPAAATDLVRVVELHAPDAEVDVEVAT